MLAEKGFTLIEVVMTVAVLVLVLFGLLSSNTAIQRATQSSFEKSVALQHVHRVIERMRDLASSGLSTVPTNFPNNGTVGSTIYANSTNELLPSN